MLGVKGHRLTVSRSAEIHVCSVDFIDYDIFIEFYSCTPKTWPWNDLLVTVHTGDKVERTFDIRATIIIHFRQSPPSWTCSTLATTSTATRSTDLNEPRLAWILTWLRRFISHLLIYLLTLDKTTTNRRQSRKSTTWSTFDFVDCVDFRQSRMSKSKTKSKSNFTGSLFPSGLNSKLQRLHIFSINTLSASSVSPFSQSKSVNSTTLQQQFWTKIIFLYSAPRIWNGLPLAVRQSPSLDS